MSYKVKEICRTVQGEGFHAGSACVLLRLSGCNIWSGREQDRGKDSARTETLCPLWCDTDFRGGERMTAAEIVAECADLGAGESVPVMVTGGEPMLQFDHDLLQAFGGTPLHLQTNGTKPVADGWFDWIVLSPKTDPAGLALASCHELKIVLPDYYPEDYDEIDRSVSYVQPADGVPESLAAALAFVQENPGWRLSTQLHKVWGVA